MSPPVRVLVVDDEASVRAAYASALAPPHPGAGELDAMEAALFGDLPPPALPAPDEVALAAQGREGHALVVEAARSGRNFAVAFIDMRMPPGWDGLETALRIREADPAVQVVICTAYSDRAWDEVAARLGHADGLLLLKKPFDPAEVRQAAAALGEKWRLARQAGERLARAESLAVELARAVGALEAEVAQRRRAEADLQRLACFDALTGLANRHQLTQRLAAAFERRRADPRRRYGVLFFDLDGFKRVNDSYGHEAGDRVLVEVARRLREGARALDGAGGARVDVAARLGGDEFVVLLDGVGGEADAVAAARALTARVAQPFDAGGQRLALAASVGVALDDPRHAHAQEALRDADTAMYRAKSERAHVAVFEPAMREAARARLQVESDLRRALAAGHLTLAYQPIVDAATGRVASLEALARWEHPDYPPRAPAEFIPVAEETGLIKPLGRRVLREACAALASLACLPGAAGLRMSVNVSRRQLLDADFVDDVRRALRDAGAPAGRVDLEITESAFLDDTPLALRRFAELRALGVGLHLDDFGTGYSSLACLGSVAPDVVKVDRAFAAQLGESPRAEALLEGVVSLAHRLGMRVTVEGIEREAQLAAARDLGADLAQGYLLHRPMGLDAAASLLAAASRRSRLPPPYRPAA